jgi:hypothetical protein
VTIPAQVGLDAIPNLYTAPNVSPLNSTFAPKFANTIHWYVFDRFSTHIFNGPITVSANDTVTIDIREVYAPEPGDAVPTYMIIGNESARDGSAAEFAMFGDAHLVSEFNGDIVGIADIPVLPLSDSADTTQYPTLRDNVIYDIIAGVPSAASPLGSGIRTNWENGLHDQTLIDLVMYEALGDDDGEADSALWVVWNDRNQNAANGYTPNNGAATGWDVVQYTCYDYDENPVSGSVSLPYELNLLQVTPYPTNGFAVPISDVSNPNILCDSGDRTYALLNLPEGLDAHPEDPGRPASAMVAFTLLWQDGSLPNGGAYTVPAQERAIFPGNRAWQ